MLIVFLHISVQFHLGKLFSRVQLSINNEPSRMDGCGGSMGLCLIRHLTTHARLEDKFAAIFQSHVQFTRHAMQYVTVAAPRSR